MKTVKIIIITFFLFLISIAINAQEKYALLICGANPYDEINPNQGGCLANPNPTEDPMDEFWNDIYLFWEMLIEQGYDNDNIFVLFGNGNEILDWPQHPDVDIANRYNPQVNYPLILPPPPNNHITDFHATLEYLQIVFDGFENGNQTLGIPQLTAVDFLFIWAFGHGTLEENGHTELQLQSSAILDESFANYVNAINCDKKVLLFAQCLSGSFVPYYDYQNNVYALSAANATMIASGTEKLYYDQIDGPGDSEPGNDFNAYERDIWTTPNYIDFEHDHSEFNLHILNSLRGKTPANETYYSVTGLPNFNLSTADVNNDNVIDFSEAYDWNWNFNSAFYLETVNDHYDDPQEHDPGIGYKTSLKYPNLINIDNDASGVQNGIIGITKQVHVLSGSTLTFNNAIVNLDYNGELVVDAGGTLEIENNVTIKSISGTRKIIVNGNITVGTNVNFIAEEGAQIWLVINNTALNLSINSPVFENGVIIAYNNQLTITNPTFTSSGIYGYNGSFTITGGQFTDSFVDIWNAATHTKVVDITGCSFSGDGATAIDIDNYPNIRIDNCTITNHSDAINLYNCGYGTGLQVISRCDIHDNLNSGIMLYRSSIDVLNNAIIRNGFGIKCYDRSYVHIEGDHHTVTQTIKDNFSNEIYASSGSFPQYLHWNLIQDDNNLPGDPMVKYTGIYAYFDVTSNCWGNTFDPLLDLEPSNYYNWNPVWNCNNGSGSGTSSGAESLYLTARENIETEEYAEAKDGLEQIVDEYPETEFAKAAMKELYAIEEYTSDNYTALKEYYNANSVIQGDTSLTKLADFLANFCDIKLENWPTAIAWFEDVIQQPETFEDSIFAIIDLGYTYWLMENSPLKSTYTGTMPQYKFASQKDYEENRDYLLSLLPGDGVSETIKQSLSTLKAGELLQNVPNPFNGTTNIWFKLTEESNVSVTIYEYTGKEVSTINPGTLASGNHSVEFNSANLPSGIYFYALEVNGIKTDTKKMTLMR